MANIRPLSDQVLLKPVAKEEKTASGIFLPESASGNESLKRGTVVATGKGKYVDGKRVEIDVKTGEQVLYSWGDDIKIDGEEFVLVTESNIKAVIE
jgi:chaperonin GroES